jgi:flagellar basal body rod protein FlgB
MHILNQSLKKRKYTVHTQLTKGSIMLQSKEERILNSLINVVGDRQQILANNLTNANTPGFVRKDIDFNSVMKEVTKGGHKDLSKIVEGATYDDYETKASYEKELAEMAKNHLHYLLLTRINGHVYKNLEEATQSGRAA